MTVRIYHASPAACYKGPALGTSASSFKWLKLRDVLSQNGTAAVAAASFKREIRPQKPRKFSILAFHW